MAGSLPGAGRRRPRRRRSGRGRTDPAGPRSAAAAAPAGRLLSPGLARRGRRARAPPGPDPALRPLRPVDSNPRGRSTRDPPAPLGRGRTPTAARRHPRGRDPAPLLRRPVPPLPARPAAGGVARQRPASGRAGAVSPAAPQREALGVAEAVAAAQAALDGLGEFWIRGEVFEYRGPYRGSGHYYFKLRDEEAQIEVKMWRGNAVRGLRCELAEGRLVLAHGRFDVWPRRGNLSFVLDRVEDAGAGDLARRFEELRRRLLAEGLFDEERKRPLPARPRRVVLITAHPSAAAADFLRTLEEMRAPVRVWLRPARVQGEGAAADLVAALAEAARARPDLVVLSRGGGSLEDLWAFNEEPLVRAVAAAPIPVLNAVGHETDFTLCDFAADARAKTPTAAAVAVAEGWLEARAHLAALGERLGAAARERIDLERTRLRELRLLLREQRPERRLERFRDRLELLHGELERGVRNRLAAARLRLERLLRRLAAAGPERPLALARQRLTGLAPRLAAASPEALLDRGYALVERRDRPGFLRDPAAAPPGTGLRIRLARGSLRARVEASADEPESGGRDGRNRGE
ncbi:MAG: exodeoxyribonuclease VII large subunit [Planctomycetota bacterium]|nr:MAG: exodeoxyribonuclease VII large subunit [Planctomycetota bacterium]